MRSLLFVDLLGVKARWHHGGREAAEDAFRLFNSAVVRAVQTHGEDDVLSGMVESDSAAVVCASQHAAVRVGVGLYRDTFSFSSEARFGRPWLRGAILPYTGARSLRTASETAAANVTVSSFEPDLLDAIAVEKAGYKGMRLLIARSLVNDALRDAHCLHLENGANMHMFKRLTHSAYPGRLSPGYEDVLWMACLNQELDGVRRIMARRLRYAARDSEEFLQAAATQLLFSEYDAILGSLVARD